MSDAAVAFSSTTGRPTPMAVGGTTIGCPVLVVEHDRRLRHGELANSLRSDGFRVTTASTLSDCFDQLVTTNPDIVIIDLGFPDATGLEACHQTRLRSAVPIIAIADPGSPIDAITTLELGADDHIVRPYRPSELIARMRAALRRTTGQRIEPPLIDDPITIDHVTLDPHGHTVVVAGERVHLPLKEFDLLHLLMANAGRVLSRETIIQRIWHRSGSEDTKSLDVHIKRLRQRIDRDRTDSMIITIRGAGYKIESHDPQPRIAPTA